MKKTWALPMPLDTVCPDCRAELPKGTLSHECEVVTRWRSPNGITFARREPDKAVAVLDFG